MQQGIEGAIAELRVDRLGQINGYRALLSNPIDPVAALVLDGSASGILAR
jgi:hypothetical protein